MHESVLLQLHFYHIISHHTHPSRGYILLLHASHLYDKALFPDIPHLSLLCCSVRLKTLLSLLRIKSLPTHTPICSHLPSRSYLFSFPSYTSTLPTNAHNPDPSPHHTSLLSYTSSTALHTTPLFSSLLIHSTPHRTSLLFSSDPQYSIPHLSSLFSYTSSTVLRTRSISHHIFSHNYSTQRHDKALWEDLIEHSLKQAALGNSSFLGSLLDHLGTCGLDPVTLISQVRDIFMLMNIPIVAI